MFYVFGYSGADVTMVDSKFRADNQYTPDTIKVAGVHGVEKISKVAKVWIHVDALSVPLKVAVLENLREG